MTEAKAKAEALLVAFLVLTSCFAASSSSCIPRRLLLVSTSFRPPCNEQGIGRPPKLRGDDDGRREAQGSRIPRVPPSPKGYSRAMTMSDPAPAPGSNN